MYRATLLFSYSCSFRYCISAFAGIGVVVIVAKSAVLTPIRYIGENSMIYYAWHQTIMIPVVDRVLSKMGIVAEMVQNILALVIIIIGLTVCNWVIMKLRWQRMLGK